MFRRRRCDLRHPPQRLRGPRRPRPPKKKGPPPPHAIAYVTRVGSRGAIGSGASLMPVDLTIRRTRHPYEPVRVGSYPDAVAIAPNGRFAYVTNFLSGTLTPVDLATGTALRSVRVGNGPAGITLTPNGAMAYVTDAGTAASLGDTVTPVELPSGHVLKPIKVGGGPQGIAITPSGRFAYVADAGAIVTGQSGSLGTTVTPIDLTSGGRSRRSPSATDRSR